MVVLDELADQRGGLVEHVGRDLLLGPQPPQPLLVDEQDAVEDAVLPHQVFGGADLLLSAFLVVAQERPGRREGAGAQGRGRREKPSASAFHVPSP